MEQAFTVQIAPEAEDADLLASREMWLLGRRFPTASYRLHAGASGS